MTLREPTSTPRFRRVVNFEKGYNYLHETGPKRRGQHGMQIRFLLVGPHGATQFLMFTGWTPLGTVDKDAPGRAPVHVDYWDRSYGHPFGLVSTPTGADLGHHWLTPTYEGESSYGRCQYLGVDCYYDGSGLRADDLLRNFIAQGEVAVWRALAAEYRYCLEAVAELAEVGA